MAAQLLDRQAPTAHQARNLARQVEQRGRLAALRRHAAQVMVEDRRYHAAEDAQNVQGVYIGWLAVLVGGAADQGAGATCAELLLYIAAGIVRWILHPHVEDRAVVSHIRGYAGASYWQQQPQVIVSALQLLHLVKRVI